MLDAADDVLADEGAAAFSTTRVAEAAGVPVGSVYRFFDDKEAIAEALAVRYWRDFDELVAAIAIADEREPLPDPAGAVIDVLATGFRARPGFLALWYGGLRTERVRDSTRHARTAIAASIERILTVHWPDAADHARVTAAAMVVLAGDGLLREAFRRDRDGDSRRARRREADARRLSRRPARRAVMAKLRTLLLTLAAALAAIAPASAAAVRARGDVRVLALIPSPGYPALPHVLGSSIFEGTYDNPTGSSLPSRVLQYTADGELLGSWTVAGQDTSNPHGVQVAANDARGRLLLLDKTSGRIIRLDPRTGAQTLYSQVPDLPICSSAAAGTPCSPAILDQAPMPDYAAWGADGSLYVTDYQQAVIWRIPPGGGSPGSGSRTGALTGGRSAPPASC